MRVRVYISGVHSGPNPSSGVGIARSLREAYPNSELIAVDYSNSSSGIHFDVFNDVWINPSWDHIELQKHAQTIEQLLDRGDYWLSSLDLETVWLANSLKSHKNLLVPPSLAIAQTSKPIIPASDSLPFNVPPFISATESDWDIASFCRKHGWNVWLKGPNYEAFKVESWQKFQVIRDELSTRWGTNELFLQAHISGHEESVTLVAYQGNLLDCVLMSKKVLTDIGKTWSASIQPTNEPLTSAVKEIVSGLGWTGGAEIEVVRDTQGRCWIIDWNPRFPAWIYGATIAGSNMPATLLEVASAIPYSRRKLTTLEFTRIVYEIPVLKSFPLPALPEPTPKGYNLVSKHPSGMSSLSAKLNRPLPHSQIGSLPKGILAGIREEAQFWQSCHTPSRIILRQVQKKQFEQFATLAESLSITHDITINVAYSVKTDPSELFISEALQHGMLVEAISLMEAQKAVACGYEKHGIVMNGPAKWWPQNQNDLACDFKVVFADSVEELQSYIGLNVKRIGIRLRPPFVISRFGIPIGQYDVFQSLVHTLKEFPNETELAIHMHIASSIYGVKNWDYIFKDFVSWCASLEHLAKMKVTLIDLGGGWFPDDADMFLFEALNEYTQVAKAQLEQLREIIIEPGKALVQSCMILVTSILEIRNLGDTRDVVIDSSIAELPMVKYQPHRLLIWSNNKLQILGRGVDRILGRLCMEDDILSFGVGFPATLKTGDRIIICDAGAYDRSMSYEFGTGKIQS